jgi:hypothetical protein
MPRSRRPDHPKLSPRTVSFEVRPGLPVVSTSRRLDTTCLQLAGSARPPRSALDLSVGETSDLRSGTTVQIAKYKFRICRSLSVQVGLPIGTSCCLASSRYYMSVCRTDAARATNYSFTFAAHCDKHQCVSVPKCAQTSSYAWTAIAGEARRATDTFLFIHILFCSELAVRPGRLSVPIGHASADLNFKRNKRLLVHST